MKVMAKLFSVIAYASEPGEKEASISRARLSRRKDPMRRTFGLTSCSERKLKTATFSNAQETRFVTSKAGWTQSMPRSDSGPFEKDKEKEVL
jgi:hypothetical protein